jgi:peptide/nickel transport system permease protein
LREGKYNAASLFNIGHTNLVIKTPYLRESFQKNGKKVSEIIVNTLPNSHISLFAIIIAIVFGIIFGIISACLRQLDDRVIALISTLGMSIPFFSAILFAWLFDLFCKIYTSKHDRKFIRGDDFERAATFNGKYCFACNCIGNRPLAVVIQLMRNSLLETLGQDYIRTARAKGLSEFQIIRKYKLKKLPKPW